MICGIDNGLDGGLVFLSENGEVLAKYVMPTLALKGSKREIDMAKLRDYLTLPFGVGTDGALNHLNHVFLERAQAMPGQGVSSMFSIGHGYGINKGLLAGLQIPFTIVSPQVWQREMFKGLPKEGKDTTRIVCQRIWPKDDWRASERCKVAHDGLCDAALIAEYGRRFLRGQTNA